MSKEKILVVDDDVNICELLRLYIERDDYQVVIANDGEQAVELFNREQPDLVLLDIMLPKMDGYQVIKKLKDEKVYTPILILSAKSELDDKVKGFEVGADDYLTKPFEIKELIMRVNAIVKINYNLQSQNLTCNNMSLDLKGCKMINTDTGKSIRISGKELQLLEMLLYNQRQVLTKEQITEKIWGYESNAEYNNVEVYISFIRRKLKQLNCKATINSIRGVGYSLEG